MSAPESKTNVGAVISVGFGLAVLVGMVGLLWLQCARGLDARDQFAQWFTAGELPFGLAPDDAALLPDGSRILRLREPGASEEPLALPSEIVRATEADGAATARVDWSKIEARPAGEPPVEAWIVSYPEGGSEAELELLFRRGEFGSPRELPPSGGRLVLDQGDLPWREFSARYVLERQYSTGGKLRDTIRVNLTRGKQLLVLYVLFPEGATGSPELVGELLAALVPT